MATAMAAMIWLYIGSRANKFHHRQKKTQLSADEAINLFISSPIDWFTHRQEPYLWPSVCATTGHIEANFTNICVDVHGYHLADIEYISIAERTATILHVGVAEEFTRRGIGPALVRSLARELSRRYGVNTIIFSENSTKFHDRGYRNFFAKIGALSLPARWDQLPDRPDYEWPQSNW